ncbi:hypothetical protein BGZ83_005683 [Gryganskiella cystojenkinii]|nr:hypothetical protein BGZ83_005683 [Gryganskiella cystojenkinii]
MTCALLRITLALTLVACVVQAAPFLSSTYGAGSVLDASDQSSSSDLSSTATAACGAGDLACSQSVDSGNVNLSSAVQAIPITQVTPVTHYQPVVQAFAPIVQSACDQENSVLDFESDYSDLSGDRGLYSGIGSNDLFNGDSSNDLVSDSSIGNNNGFYYGTGSSGYGSSMYRRNLQYDSASSGTHAGSDSTDLSGYMNTMTLHADNSMIDTSSQMGGAANTANCAEGSDCSTSIPAQNVDLGSQVSMVPTTAVQPATFYQPQVQALESQIDATPAQSTSLPPQNVNLGSNVQIQPLTQVLPQTMYQPEVHQLETAVLSAPQQDQSLPQSSVQLGSSVHISPQVVVTPITQFQSTVQSLPFIIDVEPCESDAGLGLGLGSADFGESAVVGPSVSSFYYGSPNNYGSSLLRGSSIYPSKMRSDSFGSAGSFAP